MLKRDIDTRIKDNNNDLSNILQEINKIEAQMLEKSQQFNLGNPKTTNSFNIKHGLCWQFENGNVYYHYKTSSTYALNNIFLNKWEEIGWEKGWLGFPISDMIKAKSRHGEYVNFENGTIFYSPINGTHFIGGAFREFWTNDGGELSKKLGFPKTDELEINEPQYKRLQQFEYGTLFWGPDIEVIYFPDANRTSSLINLKLSIIPSHVIASCGDEMTDKKNLEIYGFMDISVFNGNGHEVFSADLPSNHLINIDKNNYIKVDFSENKNCFTLQNNKHAEYNITSFDIENGYIRVTYSLNDHDSLSSDDYLQLQGENGRWNYKNGDFKYRDFKLKNIYNSDTYSTTDILKESNQHLNILYRIRIETVN